MHGGIRYFFDSYAIIAILEGNEKYQRFKISEGATTLLNLMEVQYYLHKNREKESDIKDSIAAFLPLCISFSQTDCYEAVKFRYARKEKSFSYIDCLGYILAKRLELSFLTGDKEFEGLPNVEFVRVKA